jgi:cell division protein FtsL
MLRVFNICLVLGLVVLAYVIYQVKYEAKGLDADIASLSKQIDAEHDSIAELRAEWSLLNRPERIERLAQKYLKLAPAKPTQLVTLDTVSDRDFNPARLAAAVAQPAAEVKPAKPSNKPAIAAASAPAPEKASPWPEAKIIRPIEASAQ